MDNITIKVGIYFLLSFAYLLWYHQYIYIYFFFSIVIWLLIAINNQQSFGYPFFVSPRHWFLCEPGRLWAAGQPWLVLRIISSIWDMMCVVILKLISHIPYIDCSNTTYIYILRYIYIHIRSILYFPTWPYFILILCRVFFSDSPVQANALLQFTMERTTAVAKNVGWSLSHWNIYPLVI